MSITLYEKKGEIAYITLNRPQALNAMTNKVKRELKDIWWDLRADANVRVGIISGYGERAFSSGSDIKEISGGLNNGSLSLESEPLQAGDVEIWKPLIAAISGWCVGGGFELALCCDIRVAAENALFGLMEPKIGAVAFGGGTCRLPNQVPFAIAMEMLLTGDPINARRAYEIGLINQLVASYDDLMPAAEKMAQRIIACAPLAVRISKEQAMRSFCLPPATGLAMSRIGMDLVRGSDDFNEGFQAFVEKRKPTWSGK